MNKFNNILDEIIQCPACENHELNFTENQIKCSGCSNVYSVKNGIPVMLVENKSAIKESNLHKEFGSTFEYTDHYQKDAHEYDYFQKQHGAVRHNERRVREYISSKVPSEKGLILDVGCGSAWVANNFCKTGYKVVSFDISLK
ncbi:MAG: hypothetical protein HQ541_00700, partial [Mariniphaga sp.]|nr:hypothetical protein [Mariniphaga sp.]